MSNKKYAAEFVKQFFEENPEAQDLLQPQEDGYLFSKDLRDAMEPFKDMDVNECLESKDWFKALFKHAGISEEEFENILSGKKQS